MPEENKVDNPLPPVADPLLERVKNTFFSEYFPIQAFKPGVIFMSSQEVYNLFQHLYPSENYSIADVANWLHHQGFHFLKMKELEYQWMLKPTAI